MNAVQLASAASSLGAGGGFVRCLFVALGGVGYAATQLPANSVGAAQLENGSVGNWKLKSGAVGARKIISGAVGAKQVDSSQVQLRVASACSSGAISAIGLSGGVTCTPALPVEFGSTTGRFVVPATGSGPTPGLALPAGSSFLVLAYPHAEIAGTATVAQRVEVDCTLAIPSGPGTGAETTSTTSDLAVDLGTNGATQAGTIPLVLPVMSQPAGTNAIVSCSATATPATPAPTVTVDSTLNAIQTASDN